MNRIFERSRWVALTVLLVVVASTPAVGTAQSTKPDLDGKVVLANLDRYEAYIAFGTTRREIRPQKASVLTPRQYPVTIKFWSGNTRGGWREQSIVSAGVYGFNFQRGNWSLTALKKGKTPKATKPAPRTTAQQRIAGRPERRLPINADRNRWSPLARAAWVAASIYQFVRDEQDRDLLRELLIRGREEDLRELERWLDDSDKIAMPHKEELKEAFEDLSRLSDDDWKEIESADEQAWKEARADLGDLVSDDEWNNVTADFADIDNADFWVDDVDVDLDEIDFADNLDADGGIDVGDELDLTEDLTVDELDIDSDNYDLGGFDDHGGYDGGYDEGGFDDGGFDDGGYYGDDDFGDFGGFDDFDF